MFQLPPSYEIEPAELALVKCTKCARITSQEFIKIAPVYKPPVFVEEDYKVTVLPDTPPSPLELLKLTKRLSLCTACGTMRLTN